MYASLSFTIRASVYIEPPKGNSLTIFHILHVLVSIVFREIWRMADPIVGVINSNLDFYCSTHDVLRLTPNEVMNPSIEVDGCLLKILTDLS